MVDDEEATLKRLRRRGSSVALEAANPEYETRIFDPDRVKSVPVGNAPMRGAKRPTVTIVEWADYQCPACGGAAPILDEALEAWHGDSPLADDVSLLAIGRADDTGGKDG